MCPSIPLDYHIHSNFSSDGQATIGAICLKAIEKGIPEIGVSEHFDLHPKEPTVGFYRPDDWWAEIERVRGELDGRLTVRAGIELGEPHRFPKEVDDILGRYPYDYAIGSLHYVGDNLVFDLDYLKSNSADDVLQAYFIELEGMTRAPSFDILGHMDVPVRNGRQIWGGYDPRRYEDLIRLVLRNCIDLGIALDVNVGGLRKSGRNLMPDPAILAWYHEMGGERLTLGSDTHSIDHVGVNLELAVDAIRAAGLKWVTQFERRQARLLPLE